eukprot:14877148-Alexandrium_andersonii.AAC.1
MQRLRGFPDSVRAGACGIEWIGSIRCPMRSALGVHVVAYLPVEARAAGNADPTCGGATRGGASR